MVVQVAVGRRKHNSLTTGVIDARSRGKRYRWHGKVSCSKVGDSPEKVTSIKYPAFASSHLHHGVLRVLQQYLRFNLPLPFLGTAHQPTTVRAADVRLLQQ